SEAATPVSLVEEVVAALVVEQREYPQPPEDRQGVAQRRLAGRDRRAEEACRPGGVAAAAVRHGVVHPVSRQGIPLRCPLILRRQAVGDVRCRVAELDESIAVARDAEAGIPADPAVAQGCCQET